MKILYITFEAPSPFYGGGLGVTQSVESLTSFAEIDYVGLPVEERAAERLRLGKQYIVAKKKNPFSCVLNLLRGLPTFYYQSWKHAMKKIDAAQYDVVYTDFSHHDFVVAWAHEHGLPVVVRVHNIESDMSDVVKHGKKFDFHKLRAILNGKKIFKREKRTMHSADGLLFLTQTDLGRAAELYGQEIRERSEIVPVCLEIDEASLTARREIEGRYALLTGSFDYPPNSNGAVWFLKEVWPKIPENAGVRLVVAGRNPSEEMKTLCASSENCILVESPKEIAPYFAHADFYVAPIFAGAGMKVKVGEALSYGLRVVGTDFVLLGYEESGEFCYRANDSAEFTEAVRSLIARGTSTEDKVLCRQNAIEHYSYAVSFARVKKVVSEAVERQQ